jgi:hypothetical protein
MEFAPAAAWGADSPGIWLQGADGSRLEATSKEYAEGYAAAYATRPDRGYWVYEVAPIPEGGAA